MSFFVNYCYVAKHNVYSNILSRYLKEIKEFSTRKYSVSFIATENFKYADCLNFFTYHKLKKNLEKTYNAPLKVFN